jgi:large subunit ribosomal protein L19
MSAQLLEKIDHEQRQGRDIPAFGIGDTVKVHVRIREGEKERIQMFTGTVIARDGGGSTETFTVRRISYGEGVERVFPRLAWPRLKSSVRARRAAPSCTTCAD